MIRESQESNKFNYTWRVILPAIIIITLSGLFVWQFISAPIQAQAVKSTKGKSNNMNQSIKSDNQTSVNSLDRTAVVQQYALAWTELSPDKLQTLLNQVWTPASTYEDPLTSL